MEYDDERLKLINSFKYVQHHAYKNTILCIYMNDENINIVDNLSLQEITELTTTLDKYSSTDVAVITRELSDDFSDLSNYFMKFNICDET